METFGGEPIDIELPSSVSGQHLVNFSLRVDLPTTRDRKKREGKPRIRAEMTLPVHLRYPDPGCERRGEDCEEYAWVEVSKARGRVCFVFFFFFHSLCTHPPCWCNLRSFVLWPAFALGSMYIRETKRREPFVLVTC